MSAESRTHWLITYVLANDTRITESTRERGMGPMAEREVKEGLELALREAQGLAWVTDRVRDGQPTLLLTGALLAVELTPDGPEAVPGTLQVVRTVNDPPHRGPDPWRDPRDVPPGRDPSLPWNKNVVPAGPDRHA